MLRRASAVSASRMNTFIFLRRANIVLCHLFAFALCLLSPAIVLAHSQVGETYPRHAQILIGGDVNITCIMHNRTYFDGNNSSCLTFSKERSSETIPKEHIHIVNETSIVFVYRNATAQAGRYVCKCGWKGVDVSSVDVGTSPTYVTDFQCIGYDFAYFTCKFTIPPNNLTTNYKLKFWTKKQDYTYNCTLENGALRSERICNMTLDKRNYRIGHPTFTFNLTANNFVGNATQTIVVDHFSRIIPAIPAVKITNITDKGVTISWSVPKLSHYDTTNYLFYEIRYRPDKFDWIDIANSSIKQSNVNCWVHINDLKYAFRRYDLTVRVKTGLAWKAHDDTMWSERFEETFFTKPRVPDSPPVIDVGSFYIDPKEENLRIYWQQLPEWKENGPDFQYVFTEVRRDGNIINVSPYDMDQTSATYKWQSTSLYEFKVKSQNQIGQSKNSSSLTVSPSRERSTELDLIQTITKVSHNQAYTVSWWQPVDMDNLIDFTLFWCISKMESQSQCKGTISSQHFDKNTYNYTTEPQNHTLNFAVSANYRSYSTGMIWAMCTADVGTELTKMDPETMPTSSNSIKLQWSTECLYTAILEGYNLTYCKVENEEGGETNRDCISAEKTVTISKQAKEYTINGLEPFTTYKILILMYSKVKVGPISNAVLETTTEDAPSPPRNLKHYNVTSNSVILSWLPPIHSNGVLQSYTVWHNSEKKIVNITSNNSEGVVTFKLNELSSFSDYKIYVTAQTVKSSVPSNDIHFKTLIGFPSVPRSINLETSGNSHILHWDKPQVPSGRVEFYEIQVLKNNETVPNTISRVIGNNCRINIPSCDDNSVVYNFEVRSVNVVENSKVDYQIFSKRDTSLYATIHQGAAKRRRHSNAEINSSIGGPYLIHENTDRHLRHRHERENLKPMSSSTTENPKTLDSPVMVPASFDHYDSNEDFMCIGSEPVPQHYLDEHQYKHFQSAWNKGSSYACGPQSSKSTMFALAGVLIMLVMLAAVYSARKKYDKMSNIGLMLPPGLEENIHTPKGVDNTIDRDEIARSDELFYEKECHSLLSKIGNDSGILNSARSLDKKSAYVCSDHQDSEKSSQSTDSVELNDVTSCSYTSSPSHSPIANIRETAATDDKFTPAIIQPISVQFPPSGNSLFKPMIPSNGYVQPQAFQRLQAPSFNGYTTLDAMGKAMLPQGSATVAPPMEGESFGLDSKNFSNKDISAPQPMNGNICGYVTCKQLSDFGQSLQ